MGQKPPRVQKLLPHHKKNMRSKQATLRKVEADPIYGSVVVTKLTNRLMKDGKKTVAQKQVYAMLDLIKTKTGKDPIEVLTTALENIKPQMEVRSRRIGGAAYQVPSPVRGVRRDSLGIRWLIAAARARSNSEFHSIAEKLVAEITDALNNAGGAVKKKLDTHRMAEANKAFAHFRW
jgi:small subunit ribosomal protein S7